MITIKRTDSYDEDFRKRVVDLDHDLKIRDGDDHPFYAQFNKIDSLKYVLVACEMNTPVGCGAIKQYSNDTMEVKRMYVTPANRSKGIASAILSELEKWTKELGFTTCILETGIKQPEAIALYKKNGYQLIPNYGQYKKAANSVCFKKDISSQ